MDDYQRNQEHGHVHVPNYGKAFAVGIVLNAAFVVIEALFGFWSHSLSLLADAGHNFSDVISLMIAWGANWLAQWHPTDRHTYGWRKASILGALLNAVILLVALGGIAWEAIGRLKNPTPPNAETIVWVAAAGIVVNTATALFFVAGRKRDLNIRGAFLHMAADAAVSAGVVIAGVLIALTGIQWIDPVVSLAIAAVIFQGTWSLLRESLNLAMDAVPEQINPTEVEQFLSRLPNVLHVHHLHIWGLSTRDIALTVHVVLARPDENDALLTRMGEELHHRFGIGHATIQFELEDSGACLTRCCTLPSRSGGKNESAR